MSSKPFKQELHSLAHQKKEYTYKKFFKEQYVRNEVFIGVSVPDIRRMVKKYELTQSDAITLLSSRVHEEKVAGALYFVKLYQQAGKEKREGRVRAYLRHAKKFNNWDLVDGTAPYILGNYIVETSHEHILYSLAQSKNMWERRISIVASLALIRTGNTTVTFKIAKELMHDSQDLIHKAVGWMLREAGKRDVDRLKHFLNQHAPEMPRTMLRYAIEKFEIQERHKYLNM